MRPKSVTGFSENIFCEFPKWEELGGGAGLPTGLNQLTCIASSGITRRKYAENAAHVWKVSYETMPTVRSSGKSNQSAMGLEGCPVRANVQIVITIARVHWDSPTSATLALVFVRDESAFLGCGMQGLNWNSELVTANTTDSAFANGARATTCSTQPHRGELSQRLRASATSVPTPS